MILAGDIYAKCMICVTDISVSHGGRNDIMKHIKGKHHQEMVKSATSTRPLASGFSTPLLEEGHAEHVKPIFNNDG